VRLAEPDATMPSVWPAENVEPALDRPRRVNDLLAMTTFVAIGDGPTSSIVSPLAAASMQAWSVPLQGAGPGQFKVAALGEVEAATSSIVMARRERAFDEFMARMAGALSDDPGLLKRKKPA
jgi:hypothetical protein